MLSNCLTACSNKQTMWRVTRDTPCCMIFQAHGSAVSVFGFTRSRCKLVPGTLGQPSALLATSGRLGSALGASRQYTLLPRCPPLSSRRLRRHVDVHASLRFTHTRRLSPAISLSRVWRLLREPSCTVPRGAAGSHTAGYRAADT